MKLEKYDFEDFGKVDKARLLNIAEEELQKQRDCKEPDMEKVYLACFLLQGHYV